MTPAAATVLDTIRRLGALPDLLPATVERELTLRFELEASSTRYARFWSAPWTEGPFELVRVVDPILAPGETATRRITLELRVDAGPLHAELVPYLGEGHVLQSTPHATGGLVSLAYELPAATTLYLGLFGPARRVGFVTFARTG